MEKVISSAGVSETIRSGFEEGDHSETLYTHEGRKKDVGGVIVPSLRLYLHRQGGLDIEFVGFMKFDRDDHLRNYNFW